MNRLRRLLSAINTQLSVLTVSQRLAIGLCAALVAGSMLWLTQWSATPDLAPLVNHEFNDDELGAAEEALRTSGLPFQIRGMRIYVRERDRANLKRILHTAQALPEERLFDMESVVTDSNPFQSPEARAYAQNYAQGNELAKIIATYPTVKKASVLINPITRRRLGGESDVPTASVAVTLSSGKEMTAEMVEGFAKLVSGAVAGLKPHHVNVTDARTGESFNVPRPEDAVSFDYLRVAQKHEAHLQAKILKKLADIPGVRVAVSVELDTSKKIRQSSKYDVPQVKSEQSQSSEQSPGDAPSETGVQANLGTALTANGAGQRSTTEESNTDFYEPKLSETETIEQSALIPKRVTAAVGIPRSFLVGVYQAGNAHAPPPSDDDVRFAAVRDEQTARVKAGVEKIVMAKSPHDVQVDVYPDVAWKENGGTWNVAPGEAAAAVVPAAAEQRVMDYLRDYGSQIGLGMLALTSLVMMMRVMRKSSDRLADGRWNTAQEMSIEEPILTVGAHPVGQAEVSESMLTGRELDETTLKYEEISGEVARLVDADPKGAADLLDRWIAEARA